MTYNSTIGLQGNLQRLLAHSPAVRVHVSTPVLRLSHARAGWWAQTSAGRHGPYHAVVINAPLHRDILDLRAAPGRVRVECAGAEQSEPRFRRPADVDVDGVLQRGARTDQLVAVLPDVDEVPVETGVEPSREAGGGVGRED